MKQHHLSIRKTFYALTIIALAVVVLTIWLSRMIENSIRSQVIEVSKNQIRNEIADLEQLCMNINYSLVNMMDSDYNIEKLRISDNPYEKNQATVALKESFGQLEGYFQNECRFFYYDSKKEQYIISRSETSQDIIDNNQVMYAVKNYLQLEREGTDMIGRKWRYLSVDENQGIIIRSLCYQEQYYIGAWIPVEALSKRFGMDSYSPTSSAMALVSDNELITNKELYQRITSGEQILVNEFHPTKAVNSYELLWYKFERGQFSFLFMINSYENYRIDRIYLIFVIGCFVSCVMICAVLLVYIRKKLIRPLESFNKTLEVENPESYLLDKEETRIVEGQSIEEIEQVHRMLRTAKQQIVGLKIKVYEDEIEKNKMKMEYYQQQIRPHFLINCLSIIYSMAQVGYNEQIKELALEMSDYLRSVYIQTDQPVTLSTELEHVKKYLDICAIRYEDQFTVQILLPEELKQYRIIPLLIHTLVENSIKHALADKKLLEIKITVEVREVQKSRYLCVWVEDNGNGYPEAVLNTLRSSKDVKFLEGKHVGLNNTIRRIEYFYNGEGKVEFDNKITGGTMTILWIPEKYAKE